MRSTLSRIMKVPGARFFLWKRPAHFVLKSTSSKFSSSQVFSPLLTRAARSSISVQILSPAFSFFVFSSLFAFLARAAICNSKALAQRKARHIFHNTKKDLSNCYLYEPPLNMLLAHYGCKQSGEQSVRYTILVPLGKTPIQ